MKSISKLLMALLVVGAINITGCGNTTNEEAHNEQGHSHNEDSDHTHKHEEVKQEEFTVDQDSLEAKENTHTHDNGDVHHDH